MISYNSIVAARETSDVIERINREINRNGILSINELILKVTSQLIPHIGKDIPFEYLRENVKIEVSNVLCKNSSTFYNIMHNDGYIEELNLLEEYMGRLFEYYSNVLLYKRQDFDAQVRVISGKETVNKEFMKTNNRVLTAEDVNTTINILNEAVRRFYEVYHNKRMEVTFSDRSVIEFRIKEAELAHLLGLNIKKLLRDDKYKDLYGVSNDDRDAVVNCPQTPEGFRKSDQIIISVLHKIVSMPDEIANFEEDRKNKGFDFIYPSDEDYSKGNRVNLFEKYSKILVKSKGFISFKPLEELSLVLNMPEGYKKIEAHEGGIPNPIHSLLVSLNFLSDKYKWTTLVANYNKSQNRRYFMSTLLSDGRDLAKDVKESESYLISKRVGLFDEDGSGGGAGIVREFTTAEQIAFLAELIEDLKYNGTKEKENMDNLEDTENLDDTDSKGPHSK